MLSILKRETMSLEPKKNGKSMLGFGLFVICLGVTVLFPSFFGWDKGGYASGSGASSKLVDLWITLAFVTLGKWSTFSCLVFIGCLVSFLGLRRIRSASHQ